MKLIDSLSYQPTVLPFGTSGLRGLARDMTDLECYINTLGVVEFLQQQDGLQPGEAIYIAGDLRTSTPRIMRAVAAALANSGCRPVNCGLIPTPALAFYALTQHSPCIMITGSHIPADRNGIKFYKRAGEVLKPDEAAIRGAVGAVRERLYAAEAVTSAFAPNGRL